MAIKTLRVFAEYTSTGFVPMPVAGGIDYGYTLANTFPSTQPSTFQTDDPDLDVTVTAMTDFYVWIRISGTAWNPSYTRNVRVYPDSPDINSVVMNMIIATGPAGVSAYTQIVQTANRLYFNGATTDSVYNSKFAGKTYINELNFGTAPQLATVATSGAYADLTGKPALATVATSGSYADLSSKPSGTAPISYNSGTNSFQITQANSTTNGFLTSTDWNTFNNKYLLPSGGTTAQYLRGDGTLATFPTTLDSTRLILNGRNTTGTTLTKGTVVYINGVQGNIPLFARAIASADSTSAQTLGVVEFDIPNNSNGVVVLVGAVNNLDTSSYTEGVQLYLSGTIAGAFTSSKILAPTHLVYVGIVTRAHPTLGVVEVKIQNGYELDEIHDVAAQTPANNDGLFFESSTNLWKNKSIPTVLGYTPYNASNPSNYIALTALSASAPLSYNNTTGAFSIAQANGSTNGFLSSLDWTTFNNKQNALTLGNVSEVSSNVFMFPDGTTGKTIGNLTIQMIQAGATTNGYLSSTDWTTFNNKQNALTLGNLTEATSSVLTITGGTGSVIGSGTSIQVKQATTSVSGFLSSTDWNTFNNKQNAITLTTTGTSGAATFSGGTLNIPQYQAVLTNPVTGTGTTNYVTKWTSSSAIGNSQIFDNGTGVGIGTATPTNPLHISRAGTNLIKIQNTSSGLDVGLELINTAVTAFMGANATEAFIYTQSNHPIKFYTNTAERMIISSDGNLGLGVSPFTNTLGKSFDIAGGAGMFGVGNSFYLTTNAYYNTEWRYKATGGASSIQLSGDGAINFITGSSGSANATITSFSERMRIKSDGNIDFAQSRILSTTAASGYLAFYNNGGGIYFGTLGGGNQMLFTSTGNLSINYIGDAGYKLYVSGTIYATGNITANSDLTLKKNLKLIENPAEKLMSLNGYSYQWKENDEYQYGVIAQEVEKVMSYAVSTGNNGIKGVAYNQLTPLLIEGFKLHNQKIDLHTSRITQLENKVKYLEAKLA